MDIKKLTRIIERSLYKHLKKEGRQVIRPAIRLVRAQFKRGKTTRLGGLPRLRTGRSKKLIKLKTKFARTRKKTGEVVPRSGIHRRNFETIIVYLKIIQSPREKALRSGKRFRQLRWPPIDESRIVARAGNKMGRDVQDKIEKAIGAELKRAVGPTEIKLNL